MKTTRVFTEKLGFAVNESTVRGMKKAHVSKKRTLEDDCVQSLPKRPRGVREAGVIINVRIVMATAQGILYRFARSKLAENGGHITITKTWAQSLLRRMGFVKRKGMKGTKTVPADYHEVREAFQGRMAEGIALHNVPDELSGLTVPDWLSSWLACNILSLTGALRLPCSSMWTMCWYLMWHVYVKQQEGQTRRPYFCWMSTRRTGVHPSEMHWTRMVLL